MDVVRVGFIGLGNVTQTRHLPAVARLGGARIVAGADPNDQLRETVAERHHFESAREDYRDLLASDGVDAVFVNVPPVDRPRVVVDALCAGKHVFCEKPLAISSAEGERMVEAAREAGRVLMTGLNQRFAQRSILLRQGVREGRLGKAYFARAGMLLRNGEPPPQSWFAKRELSGGGALMDQGSSVIDLLLWLFDFPEVEAADGVMGRHILGEEYDAEDFAALSLRLSNGVAAHVELAWVHNNGPAANKLFVDLYGSAGGARSRARWSGEGHPLTFFRRAEGDQVVAEPAKFEPGDSHLEQDRHFIDCARGAAEPESPPEAALRSLRIIEDIYRRNGASLPRDGAAPLS